MHLDLGFALVLSDPRDCYIYRPRSYFFPSLFSFSLPHTRHIPFFLLKGPHSHFSPSQFVDIFSSNFLQPLKTSPIMTATTKTGDPLDRGTLDTLLRKHLFYNPSFELYGGVSGLYDIGPPGSLLQDNIIEAWKKHFVREENMLLVYCATLTPHEVLKTSGHVEKFVDWVSKDQKTGERFRADHTVKEILEARLNGDKEARGAKIVEEEDADKKKRKKKLKDIQAMKLDDKVVEEYQEILAKVSSYELIH